MLIFIFLFHIFLNTYAKDLYYKNEIDLKKFIKSSPRISKNHLYKFDRCLVQDQTGRIKPMQTVSLELLKKIYGKDNIEGLNASEWMLSIYRNPNIWMRIPFIKVNKNCGNKLLKKIKANKKNYISLINLYNFNINSKNIEFILYNDYNKSFLKKPSNRNKYDKEIININEKIGIISSILQGKYFRIFPIPNDPNNTWSGWIKENKKIDIKFMNLVNKYFSLLDKSQISGKWDEPNKWIDKVKYYQKIYSKKIIPSNFKIEAEIFYNNSKIFYRSIFFYFIIGFFLLFFSFLEIFNFSYITIYKKIINYFIIIIKLIFLINTLNLIIRWYISNHAPWSNGYESAIFISWSTILIGILFNRYKNTFILSISSICSSSLLLIANSNLMDSTITNLAPVLKSYWLIIHVSVIILSYGFFFISGFLGFIVLIIYIIYPIINNFNIIRSLIKELTVINEIILIIGLFLLTVGTFLGGIWANESWGSYWSWDPKETWALISIFVYTFVLHMRLVPGLKSNFAFNFASIFSFFSIIITYFGVNYYLSGLHSYAKGDFISIPVWLYYILFLIIFIGIISNNQSKKIFSKL